MAVAGGPPPPSQGGDDPNEFLRKLTEALPLLTEEVNAKQAAILEHERKKKELEIGYVGRFIGEADPRIRVAVVLLCFFMVLLLLIVLALLWKMIFAETVPDFVSTSLDKIITGLLALLTGGAGYIFGHQQRTPTRTQSGERRAARPPP